MKAPWSWRRSLLGGFGAVLVQSVGPAAGDPGQEVLIVLGGRAGQGVFHPGRGLRIADMPDPVQCGGDDRRGPGGDLAGGEGGAEFLVHGGHQPSGQPLPGQQTLGEGEPAPDLRRADQQPRPQELHGIPIPVIHGSRAGHSGSPAGYSGGHRPA